MVGPFSQRDQRGRFHNHFSRCEGDMVIYQAVCPSHRPLEAGPGLPWEWDGIRKANRSFGDGTLLNALSLASLPFANVFQRFGDDTMRVDPAKRVNKRNYRSRTPDHSKAGYQIVVSNYHEGRKIVAPSR